jgi:hypothetical protein
MFWNSPNSNDIRSASRAVLRCAVVLLLWQMQSPAIGQESHHVQTKPKTGAAPAVVAKPPAAPVPFAVGETLEYQVLWSQYRVRAATLDYSIIEKRDFYGHAAWHFRLMAHTTNTMRTVYPLDDQFDSYTDAAQLASLQYEMYIHELAARESHLFRITTGAEPAPANATAVRALPGTRDAVGIIYALRAVDWQHTPEFRAPVFEGRNIYDVHARLEAENDSVLVPAGQLAASRIAVDIFENGKQRQDISFHVWLAKDAARTPLLIAANVPIGTARIELLSLPKR